MNTKSPLFISVLICTFNDQQYIRQCISSILDQTVCDFELVIVDDSSTDKTPAIIKSFSDKRITYYRNEQNVGIASSRNKCIDLARGDLLFFTDGDCVVERDWLEKGLRSLEQQDCVGLEGETFYVTPEFQPTFSDRIIECHEPGQYMTCNIVYRKRVFATIGSFNTQFKRNSDRDFGLRAKKIGKIAFSKNMIVFHQRKKLSPSDFVRQGAHIENWVLLYKLHNEKMGYRRKLALEDKRVFHGTIILPERLITIFFPPLILGSLLRYRFKNKEDYDLIPFIYLQIIYERLCLWRKCVEQRVFLI